MQLVFSFTHCKQLVAQNYGDTDDPQIGRAFYVTKVASVDKDYILFFKSLIFFSKNLREDAFDALTTLIYYFFKSLFPFKQTQTISNCF